MRTHAGGPFVVEALNGHVCFSSLDESVWIAVLSFSPVSSLLCSLTVPRRQGRSKQGLRLRDLAISGYSFPSLPTPYFTSLEQSTTAPPYQSLPFNFLTGLAAMLATILQARQYGYEDAEHDGGSHLAAFGKLIQQLHFYIVACFAVFVWDTMVCVSCIYPCRLSLASVRFPNRRKIPAFRSPSTKK